MDSNVLIAIITTAGSALVAITALILVYRGFASIDSGFSSMDARFSSMDVRFSSLDARFSSLTSSIDARFASVERRLEAIQADLKESYRILADHDKRISRLEDKS